MDHDVHRTYQASETYFYEVVGQIHNAIRALEDDVMSARRSLRGGSRASSSHGSRMSKTSADLRCEAAAEAAALKVKLAFMAEES